MIALFILFILLLKAFSEVLELIFITFYTTIEEMNHLLEDPFPQIILHQKRNEKCTTYLL